MADPNQNTQSPAGLPPGAVLRPMGSSPAAPSSATATPTNLPPGATLRAIGSASSSTDTGKQTNTSDANEGSAAWFSPIVGGLKELNSTFEGAAHHLIDRFGLTPESAGSLSPEAKAALAADRGASGAGDVTGQLQGVGEHIGGAVESIVEFMGGEEALKGLSIAERLSKITKFAKILEEYPKLAKAIGIGGSQAAVGAAQATAKGDDHPLITGAIAGAGGAIIGGATDAAARGVSKVAPDVEKIAGEEIPRLASQRPGASALAGNAASISSEPEIAAAQQTGAKNAISNIAQNAARKSLKPFEAAEPELQITEKNIVAPAVNDAETISRDLAARNAQKQIGSTAATLPRSIAAKGNDLVDELGSTAGTVPDSVLGEKTGRSLTAKEVKTPFGIDVDEAAGRVRSFGDAAAEIKKAAAPIYDKLNEVSDGEFTTLQNKVRSLQQQAFRDPGNEEIPQQLKEAEGKIERLFQDHAKDVSPDDLANARNGWHDAKILEKIHDAVDGAFDGIPESVAKRTGITRGFSGDDLQNNLGSMLKKIPQKEVERVIGSDGLDNLYRVARLTSTPERAAKFGELAGAIAKAAGPHGIFGMASDAAKRAVLHQAAINPKIAKNMEYVLSSNVSSRIGAGLIAHMIKNDPEGGNGQ